MNIRERVESLGITFPAPPRPAFNYISVVVYDNTAYISGQLPRLGESVMHPGKVGAEVTLEQAREAARLCILYGLAALEESIGDLGRVDQILKVNGFVNSAPGFIDQPKVLDAASDLLLSLFGERGRHARSAVGVAELPRNTPVEIEMIVGISNA